MFEELDKKFGIVVFYDADYTTRTIKETGRTDHLSSNEALYIYSNTPNPPSQILMFNDYTEREQAEAELQMNIRDRKWLDELFDCI